MLNQIFANYHLKTKYNATEKQLRPIINMSKYISFYAYRPYLDPELNTSQKFIVHNMMNLRSGYHVAFDKFVQNEITHELVYNFVFSVDENLRYDDLLEYFDELHGYGFFSVYEEYQVSRLREVLVIIKNNNLDITSVDALKRKKLAKKTIQDYKYFDHRRKIENSSFLNSLKKLCPKFIREFIFRNRVIIFSFLTANILLYLFYL